MQPAIRGGHLVRVLSRRASSDAVSAASAICAPFRTAHGDKNWCAIGRIGPGNLERAPVALSISDRIHTGGVGVSENHERELARTAEELRLGEAPEKDGSSWRQWGPYLSERQWGTVREDYSENGDAWDYFTHDQARSRAYHWGEDGLAGISDDQQRLCFSLALWNGKDPILKERLFGLTNSEGNHGEDVKEYYFYLDSTPTHSYMKYLYKYPQAPIPYDDLVETNRQRGRKRNGI